MAFVKMYTTPRLPHNVPKTAMDLETGHLDSAGSAAKRSCVDDDDVDDDAQPPRLRRRSIVGVGSMEDGIPRRDGDDGARTAMLRFC
jgi:hypothetical protein